MEQMEETEKIILKILNIEGRKRKKKGQRRDW
jgi:hypothetical protein